jgi:hypothetical protein
VPEASTSIASAVSLLLVGLFCHVFHQLTRATVSIDSIAAIEPCKHLPYLFERVRQVLPGQVPSNCSSGHTILYTTYDIMILAFPLRLAEGVGVQTSVTHWPHSAVTRCPEILAH